MQQPDLSGRRPPRDGTPIPPRQVFAFPFYGSFSSLPEQVTS